MKLEYWHPVSAPLFTCHSLMISLWRGGGGGGSAEKGLKVMRGEGGVKSKSEIINEQLIRLSHFPAWRSHNKEISWYHCIFSVLLTQ